MADRDTLIMEAKERVVAWAKEVKRTSGNPFGVDLLITAVGELERLEAQ